MGELDMATKVWLWGGAIAAPLMISVFLYNWRADIRANPFWTVFTAVFAGGLLGLNWWVMLILGLVALIAGPDATSGSKNKDKDHG